MGENNREMDPGRDQEKGLERNREKGLERDQEKKLEYRLSPLWDGSRICGMDVKIMAEDPESKAGEELFKITENLIRYPFTCPKEEIKAVDGQGEIPLHFEKEEEFLICRQRAEAARDTKGDVIVSYRCQFAEALGNPPYDMGYEGSGANGAGTAFLPEFPKSSYEIKVCWDMSAVPEGFTAVSTWGDGDFTIRDASSSLLYSYYYIGSVCRVENENFGFYWYENPNFDGQAIGSWTLCLYEKMAGFFGDEGKSFRVFLRGNYAGQMNGMALPRAFILLYERDKKYGIEDFGGLPDGLLEAYDRDDYKWKNNMLTTLPHEMVHVWTTVPDEPFGNMTWFVEGTAEYYGLLLPYRFGLMSREDALTTLNLRALRYYENPFVQSDDYEPMQRAFGDEELMRVHYGRGFFYLTAVDRDIRLATGGKKCLDDLVLGLLAEYNSEEKMTNELWNQRLSELLGYDSRPAYEAMRRGKTFIPDGTFLGNDIVTRAEQGMTRREHRPCTVFRFEGGIVQGRMKND